MTGGLTQEGGFFLSLFKFVHCSRFERPPIAEPKEWWHRMAVQRKNVYRRLPLEHVGAENCISEHTILRAHDRSLPLMIKMFFSNNYGKRSFAATETKVGLQK
jgi:hypothetical protein